MEGHQRICSCIASSKRVRDGGLRKTSQRLQTRNGYQFHAQAVDAFYVQHELVHHLYYELRQVLVRAVLGQVSGVVVAGVGNESERRLKIQCSVDRFGDELLEQIDLDRHIRLRKQRVEHTRPSIREIHSVFHILGPDLPPPIRDWRSQSEMRSEEIGQDPAIRVSTGGFAREGDSVGSLPRVRQGFGVVPGVRIRISEDKHLCRTEHGAAVVSMVSAMVTVVVVVAGGAFNQGRMS